MIDKGKMSMQKIQNRSVHGSMLHLSTKRASQRQKKFNNCAVRSLASRGNYASGQRRSTD